MTSQQNSIGVVGSGTMGRGIAQVAAIHGAHVLLHDVNPQALEVAQKHLTATLDQLIEKKKIEPEEARRVLSRIHFVEELDRFSEASLVIEAIVEELGAKQHCFRTLEMIVTSDCVIATNTSSLSVTAIANSCEHPERILGTHFFNPVPLMPLVEIIPTDATAKRAVDQARRLMERWGKMSVLAKDTPGFIVNRIARPFYCEALRILEEGLADVATIDWAMKELGGFRMGPFELMDFIGHDVNLKTTQSLYEGFDHHPRFKPSPLQLKLVKEGKLGRKSGRGFYDYSEKAPLPLPQKDQKQGEAILFRILCMLINEAANVVFEKVASIDDVELAMTKGVNYPKGLFAWAHEMSPHKVLGKLTELQARHGDCYQPSPLLAKMVEA